MERGSGILLHITSLPSPFGIGDLGPSAFRFADFLCAAGQKYWQILPLNPTTPACNNSPYLSSSAFAGNTLLISPDLMIRDGFLMDTDLGPVPDFPRGRVDYGQVLSYKRCLFDRAFAESGDRIREDKNYREFCRGNAGWLDDFALFLALANSNGETVWNTWSDPVRFRERDELDRMNGMFTRAIEREKFLQYVFFLQWESLRRYCREKGIRIIGDMPMYLHYNSADVWVHPELFLLDDRHLPTVVAGVPPDYFSRTGQLWNNPLYRWQEHERTGFSWWILRFRHTLSLFDRVRIDHFRGLVAYYEIPAGAKDATRGRWVDAPAQQFLRVMKDTFPDFPVIAEDLGAITPDVREIMKTFDIPGMRILQFAFTSDLPGNVHAPHNLPRDVYLYTGTHDNAPVRGWFERTATKEDKERLLRYLGREYPAGELPEVFIRMAMMSVAGTTIIPLQDILGLGNDSRMNTPGTRTENWEWRVTQDQLSAEVARHLFDMTQVYGRT